MLNKNIVLKKDPLLNDDELFDVDNFINPKDEQENCLGKAGKKSATKPIDEVLFLTSYPPRVCGIATYSQDLVQALSQKFNQTFSVRVCALENGDSRFNYPAEVKYSLNTAEACGYLKLASMINQDTQVKMVVIQHEFGFFSNQEQSLPEFIYELNKPVIVVFHTVLPHPDEALRTKVRTMVTFCRSVIVMTRNSANILMNDYGLSLDNITVIAHGTHLVPHLGKSFLKSKYGFTGRKVLATFGLLSSGKSIETTIDALPAIIAKCPEVIFLVISKTHPEVLKHEGEKYRESLEAKVKLFHLEKHVKFINNYLETGELLEYLQLTDIYLFTTNDPNQAVSGTFAYAMSCSCPIISTPIPHAREVLTTDTGIIIDFRNSKQLSDGVLTLLENEALRKNMSLNTLQKIIPTSWENSAIAHALLFENVSNGQMSLTYSLPSIKLDHLRLMTTGTGIIQFSKINQPDIHTGYTLDDNARALVATSMYYEMTHQEACLSEIEKYLAFIKLCQQPSGNFLNYVDKDLNFTAQNKEVNLEDSNGRAVWALGYLISLKKILPADIINNAERILYAFLQCLPRIHSTRAMAFAIKGLYYYHKEKKQTEVLDLITTLANRLVQMHKHESNKSWNWFEGYLTYANSILPEALLYAWKLTGNSLYRDISISSFNFLQLQIFKDSGMEVISNKKWLTKGETAGQHGEQPIDVAYTVMTLDKFFEEFKDETYYRNMVVAFNWFLGKNRLRQIVYNPCTGGCYDGLEETQVNLNQGAESTVSYLMARLTMEKYAKPLIVESQPEEMEMKN
jgi:glycosyltransferase involved in cell wall biosynthesis